MKVCSSCGKEGDDAFVSCPYCGAKYEEEAPATADEAAVEETPATENVAAEETPVDAAPAEAAPAAESEGVSVLSKKAFGKKAEKFENKNHFIVNGVVALFSLVIFVLTFFAGVKIAPQGLGDSLGMNLSTLAAEYSDESGESGESSSPAGLVLTQAIFEAYADGQVGINQSSIDLIVGAFGLIETSKVEMAKYVQESTTKYFTALTEASVYYAKDLTDAMTKNDEDAYIAVLEKIMSRAASKSGFNVVKYNYYMARLGGLKDASVLNAYAGIAFGVITGIILLATLIATVAFAINTIVALVKRKKTKKPLFSLTLPLALSLAAFAVACANPVAKVNGALIASVVVSLVGLLCLCCVRRLILAPADTFNVKSLVRGGVSLICGLLGFFLLCGTLFTVKAFGETANASIGVALGAVVHSMSGGPEVLGTMGYMTLAYGVITWAVAAAMAAKCINAAWRDLYLGKDEVENRKGKKGSSIAFSITAAICAVLTVVLWFITYNKAKPGIGIPVVFAIIFLVASAVVKGVLPSKREKVEEDEE